MNSANLIGSRPDEILRRFVIRLRESLNVSDMACFIVDEPFSTPSSAMPDHAYLVSYEGASFNEIEDQFSGYLMASASVNVTCFNRLSAIDESLRADSLVTRRETNLFEMSSRVLRALVGWRLGIPNEPDIEIGAYVKAVRCSKPTYMQTDSGSHGMFIQLTFSVKYRVNVCDGEMI